MSVIAWDGFTKVLAVDRQSTCSELRAITSKSRRLRTGEVLAWIGDAEQGLVLAAWYEKGANPALWPEFQKDEKNWTRLVVASAQGLKFYERLPVAQSDENRYQAFGSGRDFALGAMAMGADPATAVEIACRFNIYCGGGVEIYQLKAAEIGVVQ